VQSWNYYTGADRKCTGKPQVDDTIGLPSTGLLVLC